MANCRSCGAEIVWSRTPAGRQIPLDAGPDPDAGNVLLRPDGWCVPLSAAGLAEWKSNRSGRAPGVLHVSHFATCPNAKGWRRDR